MNRGIYMPWLKSPGFDLGLILLPSVFSVILAFAIAQTGASADASTIPLWVWLIFILGIDVSHVYSTLFRTYWNSQEYNDNKKLFTLIPLAVWAIGTLLYSWNALYFWRVLAYVAVFHFIRQQYGFLRLYARNEKPVNWPWLPQRFERHLDASLVYLATLYPMVFWHAQSERNFHWFIDGDFWTQLPPVATTVMGILYALVAALYAGKEILRGFSGAGFNLPKNILLLGTALSWYVGIVLFNGDLIFTITNVVSHGIPYLALVWLYGERLKDKTDAPVLLGRFQYRHFFSKFSLPLFFGTLLFLAYIEEGFWAGLVWREHLEVFQLFSFLPKIRSHEMLSFLVPLLTLPQATHYVLDGFIWKIKAPNASWQQLILRSDQNFDSSRPE